MIITRVERETKPRGKNAINRYLEKKDKIAEKYSLPVSVVRRLDLKKVEELQSLPTGTKGNRAYFTEMQQDLLVKTNIDDPVLTAREIIAHMQLRKNPELGQHLLKPIFSNEQEGVLALEFFPGKDLKKLGKQAETEDQDKGVRRGFYKATRIFKKFWFSQKLRPGEKIEQTMLVREWPTTDSHIEPCTKIMSQAFLTNKLDGIESQNDSNPLYTHRLLINGKIYPSIREIRAMGNIYLKLIPPLVISGHRDPHGGNIILNEETNQLKILDTGDAGDTAYAPEISKYTKILTPSAMTSCKVNECSVVEMQTERGKEKMVKIDVDAEFSPTISKIDKYVKRQLPLMAKEAKGKMKEAIGRDDYNLKKGILLAHSLGRLNEVTYGFLTRFKNNPEMARTAGLWSVAQAAIEYKAYKDIISREQQKKRSRREIN